MNASYAVVPVHGSLTAAAITAASVTATGPATALYLATTPRRTKSITLSGNLNVPIGVSLGSVTYRWLPAGAGIEVDHGQNGQYIEAKTDIGVFITDGSPSAGRIFVHFD